MIHFHTTKKIITLDSVYRLQLALSLNSLGAHTQIVSLAPGISRDGLYNDDFNKKIVVKCSRAVSKNSRSWSPVFHAVRNLPKQNILFKLSFV